MNRVEPDRAALEVAHRILRLEKSIDEIMQNAALKLVLENVARRHMIHRDLLDIKKYQANDID